MSMSLAPYGHLISSKRAGWHWHVTMPSGLARIMSCSGWIIKPVSVTIKSLWFGAEMLRYCCLALSSFMWPHFNESLFGSFGSLMCERWRLKILSARRPLSARDLGWQALQTAAIELAVMEPMRCRNHSTFVLWPLVAFSTDERSSSLNSTLWLILGPLRAIGSGRLSTSSKSTGRSRGSSCDMLSGRLVVAFGGGTGPMGKFPLERTWTAGTYMPKCSVACAKALCSSITCSPLGPLLSPRSPAPYSPLMRLTSGSWTSLCFPTWISSTRLGSTCAAEENKKKIVYTVILSISQISWKS